ncbi:hypothetical protein DL96DRAFT_1456253 [Flagelloscypha sp. PMI_526]|nr:hypothetical protein DL96DRAFT_1456253 [Flagelloscypha sp. PMI_526]
MGGPNLEIFKFGLYLFIPLAALVHFGDPQWYQRHVVPYRQKLFPPEERTIKDLPKHQQAVRDELARIKAERIAKAQEKQQS